MEEEIVRRSVTICGVGVGGLVVVEKRRRGRERGGGRGGKDRRTRLSNVFRRPTNTMSPSTKYAYSACRAVRTMYLRPSEPAPHGTEIEIDPRFRLGGEHTSV